MDDRVLRLKEALFDGDCKAETSMSIVGDGVVVGNNNRVMVVKIEASEDLSPAQKLRISELVGSVVAASRASGKAVAYQSIWRRLQRHFRVNSYHALTKDQFSTVEAFLKQLYARAKKGDL